MHKKFLSTLASQLFQRASIALIVVIVARFFGPMGQGVYSLLKNFVSICILFLDMGISVSIIYFAGKKIYPPSTLVWISTIAAFINGLIGIILANVLYLSFPSILKGINLQVFEWSISALPFFLLVSFLSVLFLGLQKIMIYNKLTIISNIIPMLSIAILCYLFQDVKIVFVAILFSSICVTIISFLYFINADLIAKPTFNWKILRDLIVWGSRIQLGNILQYLNYRFDIFIINYFLNPMNVGLYFVAVAIAESILMTTKSMAIIILSDTVNLENKKSSTALTAKTSRIGFSLNIIISIAMAILSPWIIPFVFGEAFYNSVVPFILLLPGVIALSITNILASFITGIGFPQYNVNASGISCIFTILLNLLFIPLLGINGAAIATSVSYIASALLTIYYFKKISSDFVLKDIFFVTFEDLKGLSMLIRTRL